MADFSFLVLDVFTKESFRGNPLAVVPNAEALTTPQMQAIARQFNLSETVFLLPPENPAHTARARIFTPSFEMPFAGHPTVGAAIVLAETRFGRREQRDSILMIEESIGPVRCAVTVLPRQASYAEFDSPRLPAEVGQAASLAALASALGLAESDIGFDRHRPTVYSAGAAFTYVPIASLEALGRAAPSAGFAAAAGDALGILAYTRLAENEAFSFQVRMFAPASGILEDPATGSAAAAFAGVLARFEALPDGKTHRPLLQGVEMGRRSEIALEMEAADGTLLGVRVGGHAVRTASGRMTVPLV
jgi:trans-2,3-dihydro-3-hydroxyanthranilate isomerase